MKTELEHNSETPVFEGVFVGLSTIDLLYLVKKHPDVNEKTVALKTETTIGGPATNAAITFSVLGNQTYLYSAIGIGLWSKFTKEELKQYNVKHIELSTNRENVIPQSSIIVSENTGDRSVVSINTMNTGIIDLEDISLHKTPDILLVDGHQMNLSIELCKKLKGTNCITVLDGGSWKKGTEKLLPYINYAICSADFMPPKCYSEKEVLNYLGNNGVKNIAITNGENPILFKSKNNEGKLLIKKTELVNTLGAGDVFHGAFCYYILLEKGNFERALSLASELASASCEYFGTHTWIKGK